MPISAFFTSGVISPLTAELAAISRGVEGVGCKDTRICCLTILDVIFTDAHIYGAFNMAYGIGSAGECSAHFLYIQAFNLTSVGPVVGGQVSQILFDAYNFWSQLR